jgi:hypothetical protein
MTMEEEYREQFEAYGKRLTKEVSEQKTREFACKLIKMGYEDAMISKASGLSLEEVKALRK